MSRWVIVADNPVQAKRDRIRKFHEDNDKGVYERIHLEQTFSLPKEEMKKEVKRMKAELVEIFEEHYPRCEELAYLAAIDDFTASDIVRAHWHEIECLDILNDYYSESPYA